MSGYENWKSFTKKDLFDDFNKVIQSAYDNTYSVSLKNYETHLKSFKEFNDLLKLLLSPQEKENINLNVLDELIISELKEVGDYENTKNQIELSMQDFKSKNTKEFKIDKHCLNNLKDNPTFKKSKSILSGFFTIKESSAEAAAAASGATQVSTDGAPETESPASDDTGAEAADDT